MNEAPRREVPVRGFVVPELTAAPTTKRTLIRLAYPHN
jgi:hypothetical protein